MPVLAGLLGTAAAPTMAGKVLGTVGSAVLGNYLQKRSNKKLAQYSFNKNVEMWKMQNQYNAPKQQMLRLQEAGLNPNLMYGKGTVGNATTMPQYQALPTSGEMFGQAVTGLSGIVQMEKTKSEIDLNKLNYMFEETFGFQLRGLTVQQGIENLTKTQLQNASQKIKNEIDGIHRDMWKQNINPNDSIYIKEIVSLLKEMVGKTPLATQFVKGVANDVLDTGNQVIKRVQTGVEYHKTNVEFFIEDLQAGMKELIRILRGNDK